MAAAYLESNFKLCAHAVDYDDDSVGVLQINLKGRLISRLAQWGLSSWRDLCDLDTTAMAAFSLSGGTNLSHWGIGTGDSRDRSAKRHHAEALAIAQSVEPMYNPIPPPQTPCDEQPKEPTREPDDCYAEVPHE